MSNLGNGGDRDVRDTVDCGLLPGSSVQQLKRSYVTEERPTPRGSRLLPDMNVSSVKAGDFT